VSIKSAQIIRSKRKTIALVVTSDARLVIRAPYEASDEYIQWLVDKKKAWIDKKISYIRMRREVHKAKRFVDGEGFLFLGRWLKLKISREANSISVDGNYLVFPEKFLTAPEEEIKSWYRKQALEVIESRVKWNVDLYGFLVKGIKITDAAKRWGSCGQKNSLNFSWRLVAAPIEVIDYVVVHELCHTQEKNHSKGFWIKLATILPHYRKYQTWLEQNQQLLDI
jgi:predicted metal-dependent hydrolase